MDTFETASLTASSLLAGKRYFPVAEANRALILVRRIVSDIIRDYKRLRELHDTCRTLDDKGNLLGAKKARQRYVAIADHLSALTEELEKIGCELKDYRLGVVDFPARLEGREVLLCWKLGEEKVQNWHELNSGFASRQAITDLNK